MFVSFTINHFNIAIFCHDCLNLSFTNNYWLRTNIFSWYSCRFWLLFSIFRLLTLKELLVSFKVGPSISSDEVVSDQLVELTSSLHFHSSHFKAFLLRVLRAASFLTQRKSWILANVLVDLLVVFILEKVIDVETEELLAKVNTKSMVLSRA